MDVIHIEHPYTCNNHTTEQQALSVAFGNFDGIHLGHQEVISRAVQLAEQFSLTPGVMTFHPHPKEVLGSKEKVTYLTPLQDKLKLLERMGIQKTFIVNFTKEFAQLQPEEFIQQYIVNLNLKQVITGFDFCFGNRGSGTTETLANWATKTKDFQVHVISSIDDQYGKISSSRIRKLLQQGELKQVQQLLRRNYSISGQVVDGEKRGRKIGFPTANIRLKDPYVIPKVGVYAVEVTRGKERLSGVLNIGLKPTFHSNLSREPTIEVHIFDFNSTIYEEELTIHFIAYLREEQRFTSLEQLKAQINKDIHLAKKILGISS